MGSEGRGEGKTGAVVAVRLGGGENLSFENGDEKSEEDDASESTSSASWAGIVGAIAAGASGGHESDDGSVDECEFASSGISNSSGSDVEYFGDPKFRNRKKKMKKKKKKKKQKKKSPKEGTELDLFAALEAHMLPPDIADKRYSSSLESMQNNASVIWMQLNRCRITDKKAQKYCFRTKQFLSKDVFSVKMQALLKHVLHLATGAQLFAAFKDNAALISLDLSDNLLTDKSLELLVGVLATGSAPNLIYVDVRANPVSFKSQDALEQLQSLRRQLKVDYHLKTPDQGVGEGHRADSNDWLEGYPTNKWTVNSMENGDYASWDENPVCNIQIRFRSPEAFQEKVESALLSIKKSSTSLQVSALAGSLREIIIDFSQQLSLFQSSSTEWTTVEQLPKGLALMLEKMGVFFTVLDLSPPPIPGQRKLEEQAVGLHRVALVELLNLLLVLSSPYIDKRLLAESSPTRLVSLFFQFPWNSILQGAVFRALQAMLIKPSLRFAVLEGSSGLESLLPKAGEECAALPIGRRPGYSGYIVRLSKEVEFLAHEDEEVQDLLGKNVHWMTYAGPAGALKNMMAEQTGPLGGPKSFSRSVTQYFPEDNCMETPDSTLKQFQGISLG